MIVNTYSLSNLEKQKEELDATPKQESLLKQRALKFACQKCGARQHPSCVQINRPVHICRLRVCA